MEVLDTNSIYHRLKPLDHSELRGLSPDEYFGISSGNPSKGFPRYFDMFTDDSFRLYPSPAASSGVTLTNGGRVWFKRVPTAFTAVSTTADDSTEPGFASPYHIILAYMSALPYCASYKKDRVAWLMSKIGDTDPASGLKRQLINHYAKREKSKRHIITKKLEPFR
jgi:hypothetical protein